MNINNYTTQELEDEIKRRQHSPEGVWEITTEGDCEGRSITRIGAFKGHFGDLALKHAKAAMYSLDLKKSKEDPIVDNSAEQASVTVPYEISGSNDKAVQVRVMQLWLGPDWIVEPHNYYRTVLIKRK